MSTSLAELDIVFVWYYFKGQDPDEGIKSTHIFGNNSTENAIACHLATVHNVTKYDIVIDTVER